MDVIESDLQLIKVESQKVTGVTRVEFSDLLSVEEPLEIRLTASVKGERVTNAVAVTMRTPGDDKDLVAGFLFTEGIIKDISMIEAARSLDSNVIEVILKPEVEVESMVFERHSFVASSCGVCGKRSIDAVQVKRCYQLPSGSPVVTPKVIHSLPNKLRAAQKAFESSGGIHASGIFDREGNLLLVREDVGRHNALDKVIGSLAWQKKLPLLDNILLVSGRASFELVQKAAHAGIPILAAVGAPSSLAAQLAHESGMTLLGFVRDNRFNIYSGAERISSTGQPGA